MILHVKYNLSIYHEEPVLENWQKNLSIYKPKSVDWAVKFFIFLSNSFVPMILLLVPIIILPSCSTNPATGKPSFTGFMSAADEARVGAEEHPKLLEHFGGKYPNDRMDRYIKRIGSRLSIASGVSSTKFKFTILNDPKVNAFALPGGYVYVTRGLVALVEDEAELAGVIAHEIGHIAARHTAERYSQSVATNVGLATLDIVGPLIGLPTRLGPLISFGAEAALRAYSRSQELEADMLGVQYMKKLGYDPVALIDFFAKLEGEKQLEAQMKNKPKNSTIYRSILSTHPRTKDRIRQAIKLSQKNSPSKPKRKRDNFLSHLNGTVFGFDRREGFIKNHTFIHPYLGFSFKVPSGFVVENLKDRVIARSPSGAKIIFNLARIEKSKRNIDLIKYLKSRKKSFSAFKQIERLNINDMEAITGIELASSGLTVSQQIRWVIIRGDNSTLYEFVFVNPIKVNKVLDQTFRQVAFSFRLLPPRESAKIQPNRIQLLRVTNGDTIASLSSNMPFGPYNESWFRLLNANVIRGGLIPGEIVKHILD